MIFKTKNRIIEQQAAHIRHLQLENERLMREAQVDTELRRQMVAVIARLTEDGTGDAVVPVEDCPHSMLPPLIFDLQEMKRARGIIPRVLLLTPGQHHALSGRCRLFNMQDRFAVLYMGMPVEHR